MHADVIDDLILGRKVGMARAVDGDHAGLHRLREAGVVLVRRLWVARCLNLEGLGGELGTVERRLASDRRTSTAARAGAVERVDLGEGIKADEVGPQVARVQQRISGHGVFIADDELSLIHI